MSHCTEVHLAYTLELLGHEVTRQQENELRAGELVMRAPGHNIVLWTRTWPGLVTQADLDALAIPSVSYHLDLYVGIQRESGLDTDPFWRTDYVFTPDGDPHSLEVFESKGINHFWMPAAVYRPEAYFGVPRAEYECDVLFVGGGCGYHEEDWPYRCQLVKWLKRTYGDRHIKLGSPERTVRNAELNDAYASAKVVVGDSLCKAGHTRYWSDRVYETTGRGGMLIHPRIKGLEEHFVEDIEIAFYDYGDFAQLERLINLYLTEDEQRERVRHAGQRRTFDNHTYHNRLAEMIRVIS